MKKNRFKREGKILLVLFGISVLVFAIVSKFSFLSPIEIGVDEIDVTIYPIYLILALTLLFYLLRILLGPFIWLGKKLFGVR